jgi:hypothetical protein
MPFGEPVKRLAAQIRLPWLTIVVLSCITLGVTYRMAQIAPRFRALESSPPGWDDPGACVSAISLDGNKELALWHDQKVQIWDHSPNNKGDPDKGLAKGAWQFDRGSKQYLISLHAQTVAYRLMRVGGMCLLLKGELGAAKLGWFLEPSYDYSFGSGHDGSLGVSVGLLVPIP